MKETVLTPVHKQLGAKMASFAGYSMPIQYSGINIEHETVRKTVGVFDVSHMGEILIKGKQALELVQRVTTNDASKLAVWQVQYSCLTNEKGGIIDDLLVYRLEYDAYMLVVNASNIQKDWDWIILNNRLKVELFNTSDATSLIAVQGPNAINTLQKLTLFNLSEIPYYHFRVLTLSGIPGVIVSNTGYTGAGGFELYIDNRFATRLWEAIFVAGKEYGIKAIGLGARDTLRLEMGYCLYGNDIDDTTSPLEAGLEWITKFTKEFTAIDLLKDQNNTGPKRKLIGFGMEDKGIPRHGYRILNIYHDIIGTVTSGTQSPTLKKGIGLGYVEINFSKQGTIILVEVRNQLIRGKISPLPFIASRVK